MVTVTYKNNLFVNLTSSSNVKTLTKLTKISVCHIVTLGCF